MDVKAQEGCHISIPLLCKEAVKMAKKHRGVPIHLKNRKQVTQPNQVEVPYTVYLQWFEH